MGKFHILGIDILSIQLNIILEWRPENHVDGYVNIGSGNGQVPSGSKPLPEPVGQYPWHHIDGLVQERRNSNVLAIDVFLALTHRNGTARQS